MSLPFFLQGLGSIGIFASRAFLPAFVTALMLRFGPDLPWIAQAGLLSHVKDVPIWFTSDLALVLLGVLAALELVAERSPEAQVFLVEIHDYLKMGMAIVTNLGVLNATDQAAAQHLIRQGGPGDYLGVLAVGAGVYLAVRVRGAILRPLVEADEDDDLGLHGLIRRIEDLWGGLGPIALIVFPLLAIMAFGCAVLGLVLVERRLESHRDKANVPCAGCGQPIHASAPSCPNCKLPAKEPREIGLLGWPQDKPADLRSLPYRLTAVKRCPVCATRLSKRAVKQACPACGHRLMDDPEFTREYMAFIDRRVPSVCLVSFLFGLVPILGVIPGVICYRLTIVAPFRRYIPPGRGFLLRWGVRLAVLLLVMFQWVPVAGAFLVPAMALINYAAYRTAYRKLALSL